jgi:phosphoglycolate phosphatase-like HAD superfamily hydrolase
MRLFENYDSFIFDCDGVIFDSNQLKIEAMKSTLLSLFVENDKIDACLSYFASNFGRSRFHHVDVFVEEILKPGAANIQSMKESILKLYSDQCKSLYLQAEITPGFIQFIETLPGNKYVASGSEQEELRDVFKKRGLDVYFDGIYGSPTAKTNIVKAIMGKASGADFLMIGDALSDLNAAVNNNIHFVAYLPFSNVKEQLKRESIKHNFMQIYHWDEI